MSVLEQWLDAGWDQLDRELSWVRAMKGVVQDPVHHAEGDVWIHTRMVLQCLRDIPSFKAMDRREQAWVHAACLLHDVAKAHTTRVEEDGRVTARGHSVKGAIDARRILWELDVPFEDREIVCNLVQRHQLPFFCIESDDAERRAVLCSLSTRCDLLTVVNEADGLGRVCADPDRLADNARLFDLLCQELECHRTPFAFANDTARVRFARRREASRFDVPPEVHRTEVIVLCGMPGAGKDTWIAENVPDWPVVSLDAIRRERGISPSKPQGVVASAAKEAARVHLRACRPFVWNATNLSRDLRRLTLDLCMDYGARVHIVYVEAAHPAHARQNREREYPVPPAVIEKMLRKWQVPDLSEAHQVTYVVPTG